MSFGKGIGGTDEFGMPFCFGCFAGEGNGVLAGWLDEFDVADKPGVSIRTINAGFMRTGRLPEPPAVDAVAYGIDLKGSAACTPLLRPRRLVLEDVGTSIS